MTCKGTGKRIAQITLSFSSSQKCPEWAQEILGVWINEWQLVLLILHVDLLVGYPPYVDKSMVLIFNRYSFVVWWYVCVCTYVPAYIPVEAGGEHQLSCSVVLCLIALRQCLSLNLKLGWWPASSSNSFVSAPRPNTQCWVLGMQATPSCFCRSWDPSPISHWTISPVPTMGILITLYKSIQPIKVKED